MHINSITSLPVVPLKISTQALNSVGSDVIAIGDLEDGYNFLTQYYENLPMKGIDAHSLYNYLNTLTKYETYLDPDSLAVKKDLMIKLADQGYLTPEQAKEKGIDTDLQTLRYGCLKAAAGLEASAIQKLVDQIGKDGFYTPNELDAVVSVLWKIQNVFPNPYPAQLQTLFDFIDSYTQKGQGDQKLFDFDSMCRELNDIENAVKKLGNSKAHLWAFDPQLTALLRG